MDYVVLSLVLLAIGIYGLLTKRHLLKVFVSVELIATAATMNFVMLVPSLGKGLGEAFLEPDTSLCPPWTVCIPPSLRSVSTGQPAHAAALHPGCPRKIIV